MTAEDLSYVYILFRPDGRPFYVGKGKGRRVDRHFWRSHSKHVAAIVTAAGGSLPWVKVASGLSDHTAVEFEKAFIHAIGREINGGPLVNQTDGGDGFAGYKYTEAQRRSKSESMRGEKAYWFGKKLSDSAREKIRAARLGAVASSELRAKLSRSQTGRKHSPETRAKMSDSQSGERHAMFGRRHSEESRRKISAGGKGRIVSAETRTRNIEANKRRWAAVKKIGGTHL